MRFIYTTLLQRVYSIEKIEPSVTVVLEWKSLNWQLRFKKMIKNGMSEKLERP
jgi:hypothetical protein